MKNAGTQTYTYYLAVGIGKMKILHVCFSDSGGGAARAAFRIHRAQCEQGIDSRMLVVEKHSDDPRVIAIPIRLRLFTLFANLIASWLLRQQKTTNSVMHSLNFFHCGVGRIINRLDVDIVNLHWVNGEMLSIGEIENINKPLVWTLHDMWGFSGAEHYDDLSHPERYRQKYTRENRPSDYSGWDLSAWVFKRKKRLWAKRAFHIVTPSRWLKSCVEQSELFNRQPVNNIPNCIDQTVYKPLDKVFSREVLNLPQNKKLILFGAMSSTSDTRKGFHFFCTAIQEMAKDPGWNGKVELLVFGASHGDNEEQLGLPCHYLGQVNDDSSLALIYSSADVFVAPSMQDNLPNTLVEAMSCGTPCVAFDVGGIQDIVDHKENGYIAEAYSTQDLAQGIEWVLSSGDRLANLKNAARDKAKHTFDVKKVVSQYFQLYQRAEEGKKD